MNTQTSEQRGKKWLKQFYQSELQKKYPVVEPYELVLCNTNTILQKKFLLNLAFSAASDRNVGKDMKEIQKV